ncbi:MAG: hypothetical protein WAU01_06035 [Saprospiraceae bacterium]
MKNIYYYPLFILGSLFISSCSKNVLPVFEVYVSFIHADAYQNITFEPYYMGYIQLDRSTGILSGEREIFIYRENISLDKGQWSSKVFVTSHTVGAVDIGSLSLNTKLSLIKDGQAKTLFVDKFNGSLPVDFTPLEGEAYEIHFIFDIKNSITEMNQVAKFEIGGDSKVVISKY